MFILSGGPSLLATQSRGGTGRIFTLHIGIRGRQDALYNIRAKSLRRLKRRGTLNVSERVLARDRSRDNTATAAGGKVDASGLG